MNITSKTEDLITVTVVCTRKELQETLKCIDERPADSRFLTDLREIAWPSEAVAGLPDHD